MVAFDTGLLRARAVPVLSHTPHPATQNGYGYSANDSYYEEGGDEYYDEEGGIQEGEYFEEGEEVQKPKKGWGVSFWGGGGSAAAASDQVIELQPASSSRRGKAMPKEVEW